MPDRDVKGCTKCHAAKSLGDFYRKPGGLAGLDSWCKACRVARAKERYQAKYRKRPILPEGYKLCAPCARVLPVGSFTRNAGRKDGLQVYCRECWGRYIKNQQRGGQARFQRSEAVMRRRRQRPEVRHKDKIRLYVSLAVYFGDLVRQPCEACGAAKVEAHHDDYQKPLVVRWLCKRHHDAHHVELGA